ncbi:Ig-like domain repeat protein [Dietzia sp. SLG310A2-38A2]|uniref:Ig-like domain-containing protein n=1 Tax=Dietzia sp. SLG310A2-38A2 TaxID=1630643 RepID=UPI0015FD720C|nr:Ig-like domain-containing protein [Dietzia sp. SLG310A2-38A2]MBB1032510.1 Ig-like domain repeat protein [Dietzia sp. SLG310A2-38A2]
MPTSSRRLVLPAVLAACGLCLGLPPAASAEGWDQGPVRFSASGDDQCQVHFTIVNETNGYYVVDFAVDGEDPTSLVGVPGVWGLTGVPVRARFSFDSVAYDITRVVGRQGVQNSAPAPPVFAPGTAPYVTDRDPITTTRTVDLLDQPRLPNRASDTHTVSYQVVVGPQSVDKGFDPATGQFTLLETEVSGCQTETVSTLTVPPSAVVGTPVDLTVQVAPAAAEGTVQFFADGEPIGDPGDVVGGSATLPHVFSEVGDHVITAAFTPAPVADESSDTPYASSTAGPVTIAVQGPQPGTGSLSPGSLGVLCGEDANGSLHAGSLGSTGSASTGSLGSICDAPGSAGSAVEGGSLLGPGSSS